MMQPYLVPSFLGVHRFNRARFSNKYSLLSSVPLFADIVDHLIVN